MRYVDEFRDGRRAEALAAEIRRVVTRPWVIMEVCGGQTHSIMRFGVDGLLPPEVELSHGPGCPVCVTPLEMLDGALAIAGRPGVTFASFGDMLRVPGSSGSLLSAKARGADVRVVYSPLDALALARKHPDRQVVFFAVGFETTAPANAMAVARARAEGLTNFSALVSHVLVPPAMASILESPGARVDAYLGPGHVAAVTGAGDYEALLRRFRVPVVITGFEPVDILEGVLMALRQLEEGRAEVENQYARAVRGDGNAAARRVVDEVFEVCDRAWRGIGVIAQSGLRLRPGYAAHDAERVFDVGGVAAVEPKVCIAGLVLRGQKRPTDCPAFGTECTPERPLGATMVSSEGACAAYYAYRRRAVGGAP
ncbi:MAG TPA: hydrogenase formation protein HypD [Polyangiaceae bacterium]|nr:hydrogenase formation protein HypD [Polyangiaceae bacterium]